MNTQTFRVFDIHAHIFPDKVAEKAVASIGAFYSSPIAGKGTAADLNERSTRAGFEKSLVHSTATKPEQVRSINEFIRFTVSLQPRLIGFGSLHPAYPDIDAEVEWIISSGLRGIKLHPDFQSFNIDAPEMTPIYRAAEGRLPILMHMGDDRGDASSPKRLARVIEKFPKLTFIAAHLGGYQKWAEAQECLPGSGAFFDTSSSLAFMKPERAVELIRSFGSRQVFFGTDYPMWEPAGELERFMKLDLTEEEKRDILWNNASPFLHLED